MRILVFGAGALGSVVAARLAGGNDVTMVGRESHVRAIRERGLVVSGCTELTLTTTALRALNDCGEWQGPAPDVVLVTVKAYQTKEAAESLRPFGSSSVFVSLQNGLGNEEILSESASKVLGAVIYQGATFLEPGKVYHAGEGDVVLGPFSGTTLEDAERVARALDEAGLRARAVPDVREPIWQKVVVNASMNGLTALLRKKTGGLLGDPDLESAMDDLVRESIAIARAAGVSLDEGSLLDTVRSVGRATRDNKSSMLQDLERGRRTEIDAINGALVERARALGVPAPRNELIARLVRAAERGN